MSFALLKLPVRTLVVLGIVAVIAAALAPYGLMLVALALFPEWVSLISILTILATIGAIYVTAGYFAQLVIAKRAMNQFGDALQKLLDAFDLNGDGTPKK